MASEKPSAWALTQARVAVTLGTCNCDSPGREPCFVHTAIATALDAARNEGRREREGEIVGWLREDAFAWTAGKCADELERGASRKVNT